MTAAPNSVNPLDWKVPIVNKDGTPTNEFMRKWGQQASTNGTIPALSTLEEVSAVLDIIAGTPDDILVRGATAWGGVDPTTLFDPAGAAATAQSNAEAFAANASNLSSGTVAPARLPIATTAAFGAVKPDGSTITIAGGVISAAGGGGGGGSTWAVPVMVSGNFSTPDTTPHATKGVCIAPAVDMTLDKVVFISDGAILGHNLICTIWTVNTSLNTLGAQIGVTAPATGASAGGPVTFTFSPVQNLVAGTFYVILITDTSAASGTTSIDMYAGSPTPSQPLYPAMPNLLNDHTTNQVPFVISTNALPTTGTSLAGASAYFGIMFRFQA